MSGVLGHFNVTARLHEIKVRMKGDGKFATLIFVEMLNVILRFFCFIGNVS